MTHPLRLNMRWRQRMYVYIKDFLNTILTYRNINIQCWRVTLFNTVRFTADCRKNVMIILVEKTILIVGSNWILLAWILLFDTNICLASRVKAITLSYFYSYGPMFDMFHISGLGVIAGIPPIDLKKSVFWKC